MEIGARQALTARLPRTVFLLCMAVEGLSLLGYLVPGVRLAVFALLAALALALALTDLRWLFALLMVEMIVGAHGRLFWADVHGFGLSLRMVLFAILVLGWFVHAMRGCSRIMHFRHAHVTAPLLLLLVAITLAATRGLSEGASLGMIFGDANGYAFLLLIPIGLDLFAGREAFAWLTRPLAGALAWLAAKSLFLLYFFSHDFGLLMTDVFRWQRSFGLSEMTRLGGGAVRIFSASDVFLIPAVFLGALLAWAYGRRKILLWTVLAVAAFLLSLSRSFWLGAVVAAAFMLPVFVRKEIVPLRRIGKFFGTVLVALGLAVGALAFLTLFPFPDRLTDAGGWNAYRGRFTDAGDAAVSSRWNMLPHLKAGIARAPILGSGFGATITYRSDDPRIIDLYPPDGIITTGAIEWQYLEIWLKMGLLGVLAVVWLWWRIGLFFWRTIGTARGTDRLLAAGLMLSFLAFIIANIFTPYINHPLGWGFLTLVIIGLHAAQEQEPPEHAERPRLV
ncbi:MAG TPA: O-antigen ligase family protein [Candidatus Baltobacteraceae bacterium]|nr:O-antigen ligase family protein [Candidatus Baltobacteraceae bacterium]